MRRLQVRHELLIQALQRLRACVTYLRPLASPDEFGLRRARTEMVGSDFEGGEASVRVEEDLIQFRSLLISASFNSQRLKPCFTSLHQRPRIAFIPLSVLAVKFRLSADLILLNTSKESIHFLVILSRSFHFLTGVFPHSRHLGSRLARAFKAVASLVAINRQGDESHVEVAPLVVHGLEHSQ